MDLSSLTASNGAGTVKGPCKEFDDLLRSPVVTHIVVGSLCLSRRHGNIGDTYWFDQETKTSYNSRGLPSPPVEEAKLFLPDMKKRAEDAGKRLVVSIAGFSPEEARILGMRLAPYTHRLEYNGACGNVWGPSGQKPIPAYEPELFEHALMLLRLELGNTYPLDLKMGAYDVENPTHIRLVRSLANIIITRKFENCRVILGNTKINQRGEKSDGTPVLAFRESQDADVKHLGGMGGRGVKPFTLSSAELFRGYLPSYLPTIGCGGIFDGEDLLDYTKVGISGFQVATAFLENGARVFSDIMEDASERSA